MQDASTLDTYKIDETKFLVVLVTKPKGPAPSSAPTDPVAAAVAAQAAAEEEEEAEATPPTSEPTEQV